MVIATIVLVTNLAFTAAYDIEMRCPAWVAYDLEPGEVVVTNRAAIPFRADPRIVESDNAADYIGSGYDRGHMAPAADFNFDHKALEETYLYSNICPQLPSMNRGRWSDIEREIRRLAVSGLSMLSRGQSTLMTFVERTGLGAFVFRGCSANWRSGGLVCESGMYQT